MRAVHQARHAVACAPSREPAVARNEKQDETKRILDRVGAETEARMRESGADGDDWAEYWGKRIGRVLSFVLLGVAIVWLYDLLMRS